MELSRENEAGDGGRREFLKESLLMGKEDSEYWKGKTFQAEESGEKQDPK